MNQLIQLIEFEITANPSDSIEELSGLINQLDNCQNSAALFLSGNISIDDYLDSLELFGVNMDEYCSDDLWLP